MAYEAFYEFKEEIMQNSDEIFKTAKREVEQENFRAAVEQAKVQLKQSRPFWHRLFPFEISIKRRK